MITSGLQLPTFSAYQMQTMFQSCNLQLFLKSLTIVSLLSKLAPTLALVENCLILALFIFAYTFVLHLLLCGWSVQSIMYGLVWFWIISICWEHIILGQRLTYLTNYWPSIYKKLTLMTTKSGVKTESYGHWLPTKTHFYDKIVNSKL